MSDAETAKPQDPPVSTPPTGVRLLQPTRSPKTEKLTRR